MGTHSASDRLKVELGTLKTFKGRIDEALVKLSGSEADPSRVGEATFDQGHLGKGFDAVGALYGAYRAVHQDLAALSKLLADQIEALSLALQGAHNGYQETDQEHQRRIWAVRQEVAKYYDPKSDPHAPGGGDVGHAGGDHDKGGM
ncbi:hypothetical protein ACQEVS_12920 [Streptomyces sp. CA-181903]|uniref:hypothetical protein n=1 Tax=Streptomyces sp. CA-181903 TaxID=3240055 RepID=UPI003D8C454F